MSSKTAGVMIVSTILCLLLAAGLYAAGKEEATGVAADEPYMFSYAFGAWDLSKGRISVEEQKEHEHYLYVLNKVGAAPLTTSWEWQGSEGYVKGLRLLLASGDIPEAMKTHTMDLTAEIIAEEISIPLDDLINKYPNVKNSFTEEEWDIVRAQSPDRKIYYIPQKNDVNRAPTSYLRKDWLKAVGKDIPKTRDELVDLYRAWKREDANGNGDPNDEIPVSGRAGMRWCDDLFMWHGVALFEGFPLWRWHEDKDMLISDQVSDEMFEAIKFLRQLYQEGLMDPVFAVQSGGDWGKKLRAGKIGHWMHLPIGLHGQVPYAIDNPEKLPVYLPPVSVNGKPLLKIMHQKVTVPTLMINKVARDPERIMKWWNFYRSEEGLFFNSFGIPEKDWTRDSAGKIKILRPDMSRNQYKYMPHALDYSSATTLPTTIGSTKVELIEQVKNHIYFGPDSNGMPPTVYKGYEDYVPSIAKLYRERCSKIVIGELPLEAWDEYVKDWHARGGEEVTRRATEWYKATFGK